MFLWLLPFIPLMPGLNPSKETDKTPDKMYVEVQLLLRLKECSLSISFCPCSIFEICLVSQYIFFNKAQPSTSGPTAGRPQQLFIDYFRNYLLSISGTDLEALTVKLGGTWVTM